VAQECHVEHGTFRRQPQDRGARGKRCRQNPAAIDENNPVTEVPIVTSTPNAAIEMKNATIAYSIAVAPQ
jgi:hypothetical protein